MRGALLGLSLAHARAHITRAVIEGVCFALRDSVSILADLGLSPELMLLTGGGARSAFVRRLQSDISACRCARESRGRAGVRRRAARRRGRRRIPRSRVGRRRDAVARRPSSIRIPMVHLEYEAHVQTLPLVLRCLRARWPSSRPSDVCTSNSVLGTHYSKLTHRECSDSEANCIDAGGGHRRLLQWPIAPRQSRKQDGSPPGRPRRSSSSRGTCRPRRDSPATRCGR